MRFRIQVQTLEEKLQEFGITYFPMSDKRQRCAYRRSRAGLYTTGDDDCAVIRMAALYAGAFGALAFGIAHLMVEHACDANTATKTRKIYVSACGW